MKAGKRKLVDYCPTDTCGRCGAQIRLEDGWDNWRNWVSVEMGGAAVCGDRTHWPAGDPDMEEGS